MIKQVYAIRTGKWVELRAHDKAPNKKVSSITKKVKHQYYELGNNDPFWGYGYVLRTRPKNIMISCITYTGGRVLGSIKYTKFSKLCPLRIQNGNMIKLEPRTVDVIREAMK